MFKVINVIKPVVKTMVQSPCRGGVNEVKPLIGRGATLSQLLTGTELIHLNGPGEGSKHRRLAWIDWSGKVFKR